ncbi:MAG: tetraacyldisaccharide 4'-kinase [Acidobacteria bacterium]|nr:MAG: tetraacyldisaccharide 4'-kinase [Acidobacteriota bacterium]RLE23121.1 MAG: tetraacyldisaccharide 4'-kinase [Acidobacteriota bacterium]
MIKSRLLKILVFPLYMLYRLVVSARNRMYDRGWLKIQKLPVPVVSVGNLTVGGTGKTPTVIALGEALSEKGLKSCILSRGYHRKNEKKILQVTPDSNPEICGDEPLLIARRLENRAGVWVGKNRFETGMFALNREGGDIVLLDDGFQHRKLHRDLDIVLVDCTYPALKSSLIPYGTLREPFRGISRADIIVLTRSRFLKNLDPLKNEIVKINPNAVLTTADLKISEFLDVSTGDTISPKQLKGNRMVAFSGIGNPLSFKAELITAGIEIPRAFGFPDHAVPSPARLAKVNAVAMEEKVAYIVTTEKDWVKLARESIDALQVPLLICRVEMIIEKMDNILAMIEEKHNAKRTHQEN